MHPTRLLRSTTFRLALIYLGIFGVSVLVLLAFIDWSTSGFMRRQTDAVIEAEIRGLAEQFNQSGTRGLIAAVDRRSAESRTTRGLYLLVRPDLTRITGNLSRWPDALPDADGWITFAVEFGEGEGDLGRARIFRLTGGLRLLVGRDIRERQEIGALIRRSLGWGVGLAVLLSLGGGLLLSRSVLGQIESINETSQRIVSGDLSRRVPESGTGDEFDQLARNLNHMLAQIEDLVAGMKQVTDNVAHDLRSPLTRLRSRLEVALMQPRDTQAYREALEASIAETDQLLRTFNALLRIGYAESGAPREGFAMVDLADLTRDVEELYGPLVEDQNMSLQIEAGEGPTIQGDRDLLLQAVANLVDNAMKYAAAGKEIRLTVADDPTPVLTVADRGPGIPVPDRNGVLQRFHRLDASRALPGNGLGLSLVAAVAKLHGAELLLGDNKPGLVVELRF